MTKYRSTEERWERQDAIEALRTVGMATSERIGIAVKLAAYGSRADVFQVGHAVNYLQDTYGARNTKV